MSEDRAMVEFNVYALEQKARQEKLLQHWMDMNLEQGPNKDWDYTHNIWGRGAPEDKSKWSAMLLDPGTAKIASFMGAWFDHGKPKDWIIHRDPDVGHTEVIMSVKLRTILPLMYPFPQIGEVKEIYPPIAEGVGACSTREKRFQVKWENYTGRGLISQGYSKPELEKLKRDHPDRVVRDNEDPLKVIFFMPDPEAQGYMNQLIKMSAKRAEMDAVFQIAGVAQRFSQEIDIVPTKTTEAGERVPQAKEKPPEVDKEDLQLLDDVNVLSQNIADLFQMEQKEVLEEAEQLLKNSDGLYLDLFTALRVLLKKKQREDKEKPAKPVEKQTPPRGEPPEEGEGKPVFKNASELETEDAQDQEQPVMVERDDATNIPDDCIEFAKQVADTTGLSLEEIEAHADEVIEEYKGMITYQAAIKVVLEGELGEPKEEEEPVEPDLEKLNKRLTELLGSNMNLLTVIIAEGGVKLEPTEFLGDRWGPINDELKEIGGAWVRDGKHSHWYISEVDIY